jgi:F0F1-type ATP synthase membrane subunit b/b'
MLMSVLFAFLATAAGKWIVAGLGVVVAIVVAWLKGRLSGAKAERAKQAADQLDAIQKRKETDDEVASLGPADVDSGLSKWMRDGK